MTLTFCLSISILSYFGDCILNLEHSIKNVAFLLAYFYQHFVLHTYIIVPVLIFYLLLLGRLNGHVILKVTFLILIFVFVAKYFRPDEWNLSIGWYGDLKQTLSWYLAGAATVLIDEFYIQKKFGANKINYG